MVGANAIKILHEVIEAHGGMAYWNSIGALDMEISARGFLFTAKRRPALNHVRMRAYTYEPRFTFFDFPQPGLTAELLANNRVQILNSQGEVIAERANPREAFHGMRRFFSWDDLDFIYSAGYATWNYLTTPFMLMRKGFTIEALEPLEGSLGLKPLPGPTLVEIDVHDVQPVLLDLSSGRDIQPTCP